jgi:O-antigen/teichoic acid export membrane protein
MFSKANSTRSNLIFNFAGRIVIALAGILFVPAYLHYLGVEIYGIIGFFIGLQAILSLLDLGISPTLTREIARLSAFPDKAREMRDLSRTLEILCWSAAAIMSVIALAVSPLVAGYWLRPEKIPPGVVLQALMLMSITFALQWTANFYAGGLTGLQRQKLYNLINCSGVVLRSAGAVFVLAFVSTTVQAFLLWQGGATLLMLLAMAAAYWKCLPPAESRPRFRKDLLRGVWTYAAGMTGISVVALILTQTDKIILSRLLTLENFGYYTLAATLAGTAIGTISGSIGTAYFPQFSQLAAVEDDKGLRTAYHRSAQVVSALLIPTACTLAFFSYPVLLMWTRKEEVAGNTYYLLSLAAIGFGLHGTMYLPYLVQLANGLTKLAFWQNVAAIILLIPFMIYATFHYGAVGGAVTWVILNLLYLLVGMQIMHRLLLKGELAQWYIQDLLLPLAATLAIVPLSAYFFPGHVSFMMTAGWVGMTWACAVLFSTLTSANLREVLLKIFRSGLRTENP